MGGGCRVSGGSGCSRATSRVVGFANEGVMENVIQSAVGEAVLEVVEGRVHDVLKEAETGRKGLA